jgi:hypothetical protein
MISLVSDAVSMGCNLLDVPETGGHPFPPGEVHAHAPAGCRTIRGVLNAKELWILVFLGLELLLLPG